MNAAVGDSVWAMGGYALYVWGSFGFALVIFIWNVLAPYWRRRQILEANDDD